MDEFIARQNVIHFRQLLERETNVEERQRLEGLMAEAQAALARSIERKDAQSRR
jgi:hypothetical protein